MGTQQYRMDRERIWKGYRTDKEQEWGRLWSGNGMPSPLLGFF